MLQSSSTRKDIEKEILSVLDQNATLQKDKHLLNFDLMEANNKIYLLSVKNIFNF